jgi:hypothetical protein
VGEDGACDVGAVRLQLGALGAEGLVGWALRGLPAGADLDGLATIPSGAPERDPAQAPRHPNGAVRIDHVVVRTPDLERTVGALRGAGLEVRRIRDAGPSLRQAFLWVGDTILEVVGPAEPEGDAPAAFWGLVVVVEDLDAACAALGDLVGEPRAAVQPGRRIATVRRTAGLGTALALMTPHRPG